ncbi:MAG TPA: alpha/beta fold hydrolase [Eoetvoesiella sp.]
MNSNECRPQEIIEVGGRKFFVIDEGPIDAACIVFSHSIMTDSGMWQSQADVLRRNFRVIRYDSRGHGKTPHAGDDYSTSLLANDVVSLLDALSLDRVHFVGLSLGGILGFDLAQRYSHRFHSLVICDARSDSPEEFARPWDARIETARSEGMSALVEPTMARWFGSDFLETAAADGVRAMISQTSVEGFVATARALQAYDYHDTAPSFSAPVTFIVGENDGVLPDVMRTFAKSCKNADFVSIPSAGHLPNIENPGAFNATLDAHLKRCSSSNQ